MAQEFDKEGAIKALKNIIACLCVAIVALCVLGIYSIHAIIEVMQITGYGK